MFIEVFFPKHRKREDRGAWKKLNGEKAMDPFTCLLITLLFVGVQSCPEVCRCVAKPKYERYVADCSYQDLQVVPQDFSSNTTTLTLSVNHIATLGEESFANLARLQGLWLSYNEIGTIAEGTFAVLVHLRALDLSHNQIMNFPWADLSNLTTLQLLKLSNNHLEKIPPEAFQSLKDLRSLWLSNNRLATLSDGTFSSMPKLAQLQINNNPFDCTCKIWWLDGWLQSTPVSIPEKKSVTCATPEKQKGLVLGRSLKLDCALPTVQLVYHSSLGDSKLKDGLTLQLHCNAVGKPPPKIRWKIQTVNQHVAIDGPNVEREEHLLLDPAGSVPSRGRFLVFKNGSMAVTKFSKDSEGIYTCQAYNDVGSREAFVHVALAGSEKPTTFLKNHLQANKNPNQSCDIKDDRTSEENVKFVYLTPTVPKTDCNGGTQRQLALGSLFLFCLLAHYS
ncbi:immunoglobulin superfamily containing leucine-rich repeat protein-like isoform X1 [Ahaetulla prasina]|uniref:immunoglobulin superfamily containing leucine-rich repeat protein-like isoform X1 n=2 Tax=Ahaetulla prasina TaxID=499056 RepID=UPI00264839E0|nr:immunoglobulin superfamily containing leucine-rich repeat protein-like isoform X1 [Ahaetulla prasina]XP_058011838.1 immunoglobulin superfamily containing leucine-rich repeat protein-like isoform X1 [Ahaetulla prasina]XP_058011839.1 immunoglobulin superfamily containing leucine-rich repeat protein-like isoform X1 [Ahaetulla prasina]